MIKAVIFDMDGTMVDTENLWHEVNTELGKKYGVTYDTVIQQQMLGRKEDDALALFKEYFNLVVPVKELMSVRKTMLLANIHKISVNKGLLSLLDLLDSLGIKKAIATSAFEDFATAVIKSIKVENRFEVFISGDKVQNGKPHPEIFLTAAAQLGVTPDKCLVLEDAQNGVEAGYSAGMKVIALPHDHSKSHDFSKATKILSSMLEIDEKLLRSL